LGRSVVRFTKLKVSLVKIIRGMKNSIGFKEVVSNGISFPFSSRIEIDKDRERFVLLSIRDLP